VGQDACAAPSATELDARLKAREFVRERIAPHAGRWEREEGFPVELIDELRKAGLLGAPLPAEVGGGALDPVAYGLVTEEIGRGCSSVRSLLTVHDMATLAVHRWGSPVLREELVPSLARGERVAAFALSEPGVGSDGAAVETEARRDGGGHLVLSGRKKWITCGRIADLFLVIARHDLGPVALLVDGDSEGIAREPIRDVMGTGASHLAALTFDGCRVPEGRIVGRPGFGFSAVAATALDHGRYSVAWGSVGIAQACLDASLAYTAERRQFGVPLREHQLVRRELTDMIVDTRAARLLCYRAGHLRRAGSPAALGETQVAKYFASRAAVRAARAAVQLHGANGLSPAYPVARYLRDAQVTEIIEGSSQIQQITIPDSPLDDL
jgi:alkylation response protein AidB-like acyl-CoA dehydrogenase